MMRMSKSPPLEHLLGFFEEHVEELPAVSRRKMFGCEAFQRGPYVALVTP